MGHGERDALQALQLISAWRQGCACGSQRRSGLSCPACTAALVDTLEQSLRKVAGVGDEAPGAPLSLSLTMVDVRAGTDEEKPHWCSAFTSEPPCSGIYLVRLSPDDGSPVFELRFDAVPGGSMWRSGEQPPNDFVVLPMLAQWRPL